MCPDSIQVTSHVSRDFLQNAAYFNTTPKLIWEYVANSLDAAKANTPVVVTVEINSSFAIVSDNGRGMSRKELSSFFQMHGENIQRKRGKRVRGRFGTGKCAAFGLANCLRIDTSQAGLRNVVELHRREIEQAQSGEPFPVRDIAVDEPTDGQDGTVVEIREFNIKRPQVHRVISYVERHLSSYRQRARVTINGHECQFKEPPFIEQFERFPPPKVAERIGQVPLIVKVSPVPLDDNLKGIDILAYGIWHGATLGDIENRDHANQLFGHIDVPILEDGEWPIPAFDNTRSGSLNPQNPVVAVLLDWLSEELERIRIQVLEREHERRSSEATKQLAREARKISRILNQDFIQQELELELARRVSRRFKGKSMREILEKQRLRLDSGDGSTPGEQDALGFGAEDGSTAWEQRMLDLGIGGGSTPWELYGLEPGTEDGSTLWDRLVLDLALGDETTQWGKTEPASDSGAQKKQTGRNDPPKPRPASPPDPEPEAEEEKNPSKKRRPGFRIDFENATANTPRSRYDSEMKTIFINLDHPQVANAFEAGKKRADSRQFLDTCYDIITVEYALAIPQERLEEGELTDVGDALFDVRETINRVTRRFLRVQGP